MEKYFVHLANIPDEHENFNIELCIICQKEKSCKLTTPAGRVNVINAANICKDSVLSCLNSPLLEKDFIYHVDNECYKRYTMKRSLNVTKKRNANENTNKHEDEKEDQSIELDEKRTRSSLTPRNKPSQLTSQHKLNCVICGKLQHNKITEKFTICEYERANLILKAATMFQDEVFTRISDLSDESSIIAADLYCHKSCISGYKIKFKSSMESKTVLKQPKK